MRLGSVRADDALGWTLLAAALTPSFMRIARCWSDPIAEHGPLILAMCAWLVWRSRDALRRAQPAPRPWSGGAALLLALWINEAAALEPHVTIVGPAALLAVGAHVVARRGLPALRIAWFPLAFALFMLPAPAPMLFSISVRLKVVAAQISGALLDGLGLAVVRVGSTLHIPGATLVVDDGCSGLRGLVAIVAFAVFLAHLAADRRRGAAALLVAVPAAIAANVLRIVVMSLLVARGHTEVLEGTLHEATGLVVYAVAIGAVLAVAGRLGRGGQESSPAEDAPPPLTDADAGLTPVARVGLLAVVALFAGLAATSIPAVKTTVARRIPERLGRFTGAPAALSPVVFQLLGDDVAARRYTVDDPTRPVDVVVIHSGDDPMRAYHPPDACFLIGGWDVAESGERRLSSGQWARRRLFRREHEAELVYYWAHVAGREVTDASALRRELFLSRLVGERRLDGTLVRMSTSVGAGGVPAAERRLEAFAAEALGPLEAALDPAGGRR